MCQLPLGTTAPRCREIRRPPKRLGIDDDWHAELRASAWSSANESVNTIADTTVLARSDANELPTAASDAMTQTAIPGVALTATCKACEGWHVAHICGKGKGRPAPPMPSPSPASATEIASRKRKTAAPATSHAIPATDATNAPPRTAPAEPSSADVGGESAAARAADPRAHPCASSPGCTRSYLHVGPCQLPIIVGSRAAHGRPLQRLGVNDSCTEVSAREWNSGACHEEVSSYGPKPEEDGGSAPGYQPPAWAACSSGTLAPPSVVATGDGASPDANPDGERPCDDGANGRRGHADPAPAAGNVDGPRASLLRCLIGQHVADKMTGEVLRFGVVESLLPPAPAIAPSSAVSAQSRDGGRNPAGCDDETAPVIADAPHASNCTVDKNEGYGDGATSHQAAPAASHIDAGLGVTDAPTFLAARFGSGHVSIMDLEQVTAAVAIFAKFAAFSAWREALGLPPGLPLEDNSSRGPNADGSLPPSDRPSSSPSDFQASGGAGRGEFALGANVQLGRCGGSVNMPSRSVAGGEQGRAVEMAPPVTGTMVEPCDNQTWDEPDPPKPFSLQPRLENEPDPEMKLEPEEAPEEDSSDEHEVQCEWPGCTLRAWHSGLCRFAESANTGGRARRRSPASAPAAAPNVSQGTETSALGERPKRLKSETKRQQARVTQSNSPSIAPQAPAVQMAIGVLAVDSHFTEVDTIGACDSETAGAAAGDGRVQQSPSSPASQSIITSKPPPFQLMATRGAANAPGSARTLSELRHVDLSALPSEQLRATLTSLGVRSRKRKAEMSRQLRDVLRSYEASEFGVNADEAARERSQLHQVLEDRVTQGREPDGRTYWIEDDEDEPWIDECDGCGCAKSPVAQASDQAAREGASAGGWFKCIRCPSVDLCAGCAIAGCREHARRYLVGLVAPDPISSDSGGPCSDTKGGKANHGAEIGSDSVQCTDDGPSRTVTNEVADLGAQDTIASTNDASGNESSMRAALRPAREAHTSANNCAGTAFAWTPERDVRLLDAVWTHRMNLHTVTQVLGGAPTSTTAAGGGTSQPDTLAPIDRAASHGASVPTKAQVAARLGVLLAPLHRTRPQQTHAPLLTPPLELGDIGLPPSAAFRLGLAGAHLSSTLIEDAPKPNRKALKALTRASPAGCRAPEGLAPLLRAAASLYKLDELHSRPSTRGLCHGEYRVAGMKRSYGGHDLTHARLREVREPAIAACLAYTGHLSPPAVILAD